MRQVQPQRRQGRRARTNRGLAADRRRLTPTRGLNHDGHKGTKGTNEATSTAEPTSPGLGSARALSLLRFARLRRAATKAKGREETRGGWQNGMMEALQSPWCHSEQGEESAFPHRWKQTPAAGG